MRYYVVITMPFDKDVGEVTSSLNDAWAIVVSAFADGAISVTITTGE